MRPSSIMIFPPLHPHRCMRCLCGTEKREFFVDIGIDTDYEGTVYLCDSCMADICDHSNNLFFSKASLDKLVATTQDELTEARRIIERHNLLMALLEDQGINTKLYLERMENYGSGTTGSDDSEPVADTESFDAARYDSFEPSVKSNRDTTGLSENPLLDLSGLKFD